MNKNHNVAFSNDEWDAIKKAAEILGVSPEEAVSALTSKGLARRVKKKIRRNPSSTVRQFQQG